MIGIDTQSYYGLLILCTIFGVTGSFISLWISKFIAKKAYGIKLIDPLKASPKELYLYDSIEKMANSMGLGTPEVGVYQAKEVNAFATGASQNNSLVAFSSALLDTLNEDEIAAVAAHEMSHIKNGDMVTMTLLVGVANTFVMFFARVLAFAIDAASRDNRRGGLGFMGRWILIILFENVLMLLAYIPISYYSRWREYRADFGAANTTSPRDMINALDKIERFYTQDQKKDTFAMAKINNHRRVSLYATHPSIEDRIKKLQELLV
jgi:heat shock protein HtpX